MTVCNFSPSVVLPEGVCSTVPTQRRNTVPVQNHKKLKWFQNWFLTNILTESPFHFFSYSKLPTAKSQASTAKKYIHLYLQRFLNFLRSLQYCYYQNQRQSQYCCFYDLNYYVHTQKKKKKNLCESIKHQHHFIRSYKQMLNDSFLASL